MKEEEFQRLEGFVERTPQEQQLRAEEFLAEMRRRRSVRHFSSAHVPPQLIEQCLLAAATAPSGANQQPWHFVAVGDPSVKREIRIAAEKEEYEFYHRRAPEEWLEAIRPFGTDERKSFLEEAPWLIAVFVQPYGLLPDGRKAKHYYAQESVGIATGILITALHHAGLATLTHTPSPMGFLGPILGRPPHERPFLLLVAGFPAPGVRVPRITRKSPEETITFL